jgi:hypothetical protein
VNLDNATASIYTLNRYRKLLQISALHKFEFVTDEFDNEFDNFALGNPLMSWSLADCANKEFPAWALSVLQPAVQIEMLNLNYGRVSHFIELVGHSYTFSNRAKERLKPPQAGEVWDYIPVDIAQMLTSLKHAMGPLAYAISNTLGMENKGDDLLAIRRLMRGLGVDPDPNGYWDEVVHEMAEDLKQES